VTARLQVALHGSMLPEQWTYRHTGVMHERDKGAGVLPGPGRPAASRHRSPPSTRSRRAKRLAASLSETMLRPHPCR
jgi:hypothetical protein